MIASSVTEHAPFGSSTAERVINCPASLNLSKRSPRMPPSQAAIDGTAQHALVEHILLEGGDPKSFVGSQVADVVIDDEMATNVIIAHKSAELLLIDYDGEQLIEQRVTHTPGEVGGTGDILAISKDGERALVADHKFGYVEVRPNSYQNKFIAALALSDPSTKDAFAKVEQFKLAIIQPSFDPAHTTFDVGRDEIEQFARTIDLTITTARSPDAPLQIGEWCTYCPAKLACPAWIKRYDDLIDLKKHGEAWTSEKIVAYYEAYKALEPLGEAAKERLKHELANGRMQGKGWRLKAGRLMQKWSGSVKDTLAALRGYGMQDKDIVSVISPAQAKKLTSVDIDSIITKSTSEPSLARDSDEDKPAVPSAAFARAAQTAKGALASRRQTGK